MGLTLIALAYQVPSADEFSLDEANRLTAQRFGYPQWKYWEFFTAPDAPNLLRQNLMRFWEVNNGNYPSPVAEENGHDVWMREMFCGENAMREYITGTDRFANYTVRLKPYAENRELQKAFVERLSRDGLEGPVCYYHSLKYNTMLEDERQLCKAPNNADKRIDVPLLYIGQTGDWVCRTDLMIDAKNEGLVSDLEEKVVQAGH